MNFKQKQSIARQEALCYTYVWSMPFVCNYYIDGHVACEDDTKQKFII